ncbi:hypothetical protein N7495_001031 [Penicillium taxi]|uniref:uncharacterized protein n=1 Tax=Penicillium taxi TaxID=168475 RepID=UPI0025454FF3|nr:uncharacterized protein N7495_001031 [Penicillium taxi]KAJ5908349.1 hypothetical protein N7495_001031 [Penicillium taxi]
MDSSQNPVVASLLKSLITSTLIPPTATPYAASYSYSTPYPTPTFTPLPKDHNGDDNGEAEWSSLIGIVTALVGNVLISVALNIQRYAHIRIAREYELRKTQKETDWRNSQLGADTHSSYGTVRSNGTRTQNRGRLRDQHERSDFEAYCDEIDNPPRNAVRRKLAQRSSRGESSTSDRTSRTDGTDNGKKKSYLRSPYWWAGIVLMTLGEMGNFMAYGFAPASIVSPLGVVALISNCIIAPCLLKEQFRKRDLWGVLISIAGAAVVVLSANSSEEKLGPDEILERITTWEFELYFGLTTGLIIALMWISHQYGRQSIFIDVGLVALFGGYTALSTKGVSSMLTFTLWHAITFPITYLLVFILVASALMQVRYINRALQRFDSTQVIPTQFVLFTLSVIIGSAVLYRDFNSMTVGRAAKFIGGCLLTFLGVYFITSGRVRSDDESSFSSEDEEGSIGLMDSQLYRDSFDLSPPLQKSFNTPEINGNDNRSPPVSHRNYGLDGGDANEHTPRGAVSATPSSPIESLTADSALSEASLEQPSPLHAPSHMTNPWADFEDQTVLTPASDPEIYRTSTPPQAEDDVQESTVLLRFPPAPGIEEGSSSAAAAAFRRASTTTADQVISADRAQANIETPSRRALRNSISNRFSPGPLFPTLSAGFSAVVAESIRRGEVSPYKDRRRKAGRRRQIDGAYGSQNIRYHDEELAPFHDSSITDASELLQSATILPGLSPDAGRSTNESDQVTRLRSFSDSLNGGLAWLGGALRRNSQVPTADSVALTQESAMPQNAGTPSPQGGYFEGTTSNANADQS